MTRNVHKTTRRRCTTYFLLQPLIEVYLLKFVLLFFVISCCRFSFCEVGIMNHFSGSLIKSMSLQYLRATLLPLLLQYIDA